MRAVQQQREHSTGDRLLSTLDEASRLLEQLEGPIVHELQIADAIHELRSLDRGLPVVVDQLGFDCRVREASAVERTTVTTETCPVCANGTATPRFAIDGLPYSVVVCDDCGLGSLFPRPTGEALGSFYPAEYYGTSGSKFKPLVEAMVRIVGARQVRSLVKGLPRGARVLDVGCGRGVLLSALANRGFEAHGFEISPTAITGADARAHIRIANDLREAEYPDGFFDQVILWHVFEHLPNPRETLVEIRRILRPGGRLVISVPNFSSMQSRWAGAAWFHLDLPRHLFHFPLAALRRLICDCGFEPKREHHFSLRQNPFGWVQSYLNRNENLPRNGLYRLLKNGNVDASCFCRSARWKQQLAYCLGMPVALALSVIEAAMDQGASVCIVAESHN